MMIQPKRFCRSVDWQFKRWLSSRSGAVHQGFTLSEVIVSILLISTFVAVALQGMVVAMVLKSKSFHLAEASHWVQTDVESIRARINSDRVPVTQARDVCYPSTADRGYADIVRDVLAGNNVMGTQDYPLIPQLVTSKTGKVFQVQRSLSIPENPENSRYQILGIQYTILPMNGTSRELPILQMYAEVSPDAAIVCK
jgi:prepilin-type N-terminal cleavage/methylation domain-containing protein